MITIEHAHYLTLPDGRCAYPLPKDHQKSGVWTGDGQPAELLLDRPNSYTLAQPWVATAGPVSEVTVQPEPSTRIVGWRLKDQSAASERFPAELTVEERDARRDDVTYSLYESVEEPVQRDPIRFDVSHMTALAGVVDDKPGLKWEPDKAHLMLYGEVYAASLPGVITDVKDAVGLILKGRYERSGVTVYHHDSKISVNLSTDFDVPVFSTRQNTSRVTGKPIKGTHQVRDSVATYFDFRPPRAVPGANKAEAAAALDALIEEYVSLIDSYRPVACSHCRGKGWVTERAAKGES